MPNHVKNKLTMSGDALEISNIVDFVSGENGAFDFSKIIPMPEEFQYIVSGSTTIDGKRYDGYYYVENGRKLKISELEYGNQRRGVELVPLKDDEKRQLLAKYGATDWYNWSVNAWGTKWNAYDIKVVSDNVIEFDTAWSTPVNVFTKLSELYPEVEFSVEYADEDLGNNVGIYVLKNGEIIREEDYSGTKKGMVAALELRYGQTYDEYLEEMKADDPEYYENLLDRFNE